ncbi:MAG: CAP domain-containing protein [Leptospiraceae bacterium]|nr:CAP domain-containing protein [Leptospiraceae bacterium]
MKKLFSISIISALAILPGFSPKFELKKEKTVFQNSNLEAQVIGGEYLTEIEKQIVEQINLARMNPNAFISVLEEMRPHFKGKMLELPGEYKYLTREGVSALDDAIRYLKSSRPTIAMTVAKGLSKGAKEHVEDQGSNPAISFTGSDGSTPDQRMSRYGTWKEPLGENIAYGALTAKGVVALFIVSDGFPKRDLRVNLFNPKYRKMGVACGKHTHYENYCVVDFSGNYTEKIPK